MIKYLYIYFSVDFIFSISSHHKLSQLYFVYLYFYFILYHYITKLY